MIAYFFKTERNRNVALSPTNTHPQRMEENKEEADRLSADMITALIWRERRATYHSLKGSSTPPNYYFSFGPLQRFYRHVVQEVLQENMLRELYLKGPTSRLILYASFLDLTSEPLKYVNIKTEYMVYVDKMEKTFYDQEVKMGWRDKDDLRFQQCVVEWLYNLAQRQ